MRINIFALLLTHLLLCSTYAQDKASAKFGDVSAKNFANPIYSIDSNANAVVVADIGSTKFEGTNRGWFSLLYKRYKRVHILNKNGYDAANIEIRLYINDDGEEKLDKLKAVTYNLENGKVVETKLDVKSGVMKEQVDKNRVIRKFTFPNVKEGSIIEYEYSIVSDFLFNLQPWAFQGNYPVLWSEYNLQLPSFFNYIFISQGSQSYDLRDVKGKRELFSVNNLTSSFREDGQMLEASVTENKWVKKNVPALKEESFTSTTNNYISKIEFQLSEQLEPLTPRNYLATWTSLTDNLIKSEFFGAQLTGYYDWLKDLVAPIIKETPAPEDKARKIFAFVRDNFTCTKYGSIYLDQTLKNLSKSRSGSAAEINLLLTAMLRFAELNADPVILSTRSHGYTYPLYPIIGKFNYIITRVNINSKPIFLDASEPRLGFGFLPLRCYNGHARVVNEKAEAVDFNSDKVVETKLSTVFISNDGKGKMKGSMQQTAGYYGSYNMRNTLKEKGEEQLKNDFIKAIGSDAAISNLKFDSLNRYDDVLGVRYDFDFTNTDGDVLYINPMFGEGRKENPFKSARRLYPVEMPYVVDETFNLQLEVPEGYVVDEMPQSTTIKINQAGDGTFEYKISQAAGIISLRSRLFIKRTMFQPNEYDLLREFFNLVVKKHSEQIVFKKKK